jgi:hypothetical protein
MRTASSYPIGVKANSCRAAGSSTITWFFNPSINGLATLTGKGVTSLTHHDDNLGVSTGTGTSQRFNPRTRAYVSIICP